VAARQGIDEQGGFLLVQMRARDNESGGTSGRPGKGDS
jgi:hypothetical protein